MNNAPVIRLSPTMNSPRQTLPKTIGVLLLALYAPYSWLLFKDWPWSSHHWGWIKSWGGLPAMMPRTQFWTHYEFETEVVLMYITTAVSLLVLTLVARRTKRALWWTAGIVLALSLLNSGYCRALYVM